MKALYYKSSPIHSIQNIAYTITCRMYDTKELTFTFDKKNIDKKLLLFDKSIRRVGLSASNNIYVSQYLLLSFYYIENIL